MQYSYHGDQVVDLLNGSSQIFFSDFCHSILRVLILGNQWFRAVIRQPGIVLKITKDMSTGSASVVELLWEIKSKSQAGLREVPRQKYAGQGPSPANVSLR